MNLVLIIAIFGLQTTLFLMGINTLKGRINSLEWQIRANRVHIEGQANKINANLEEVAQFNEKALITIAEDITACGYEVKEVKDKLENVNETIRQETAKRLYLHLQDKF